MQTIEYKLICSKTFEEIEEILQTSKKKLALLYGNCQIVYLTNYLVETTSFLERYIMVVNMPAVQSLDMERKTGISPALLKSLDLFIYQKVGGGGRHPYGENLTTSVITKQLNPSCVQLMIPNLYFKGYFPQDIKNKRNVLVGSKWHLNGVIPYGDFVLETFFARKRTDSELEHHLLNEHLFLKEYVIWRAKNSLDELKKREEVCDIRMSDYIEENYKTQILFHTPNHPADILTFELLKRILQKLQMLPDVTYKKLIQNDKLEMLIYPSVQSHLGLQVEKTDFYMCRGLKAAPENILNYARSYGYFCFLEFEKNINMQYEESVELYSTVAFNTDLVQSRATGTFTILQGSVHFSIYLDILTDVKNEAILFIPKEYAPLNSYYATGMVFSNGGAHSGCIVKIENNGTIRCNVNQGKCVMALDTSWSI